jgi:hypothetical protein
MIEQWAKQIGNWNLMGERLISIVLCWRLLFVTNQDILVRLNVDLGDQLGCKFLIE